MIYTFIIRLWLEKQVHYIKNYFTQSDFKNMMNLLLKHAAQIQILLNETELTLKMNDILLRYHIGLSVY